MDRINIALSATEDNAAAIRELNKALVRRTSCKILTGSVGTSTTFGAVTSGGSTGVVVTFSGDSVDLMFGTDKLLTGQSPMIAILPAGTKELRLSGQRSSARALIIGG